MGPGRDRQRRSVPRDPRRGHLRQLHLPQRRDPPLHHARHDPRRGAAEETEGHRRRQLRHYKPTQPDPDLHHHVDLFRADHRRRHWVSSPDWLGAH
jgi:hypothetical protein